MIYTREKSAERQRDKLYGLLGLKRPEVAASVVPQYVSGVSDDQVFQDFARTWIMADGSLDILGQCSIVDDPSWVPRLHTNYCHLLSATEPACHAAKHSRAEVRFTENGKTLVCEGIPVDVVQSVSTVFWHNWAEDLPQRLSEEEGQHGHSNHSNAYPGGPAALREAIWCSMVGGRDIGGATAPAEYASLLSPQSLRNADMVAWVKPSAGFCVGGRPLVSYFQSQSRQAMLLDWLRSLASKSGRLWSRIRGWWLRSRHDSGTTNTARSPADTHTEGQHSIHDEAVERITRFAFKRRLLTTERGLVGFGAEVTRPGDVVAVCSAAASPCCCGPEETASVLSRPATSTASWTARLLSSMNKANCQGGHL